MITRAAERQTWYKQPAVVQSQQTREVQVVQPDGYAYLIAGGKSDHLNELPEDGLVVAASGRLPVRFYAGKVDYNRPRRGYCRHRRLLFLGRSHRRRALCTA